MVGSIWGTISVMGEETGESSELEVMTEEGKADEGGEGFEITCYLCRIRRCFKFIPFVYDSFICTRALSVTQTLIVFYDLSKGRVYDIIYTQCFR